MLLSASDLHAARADGSLAVRGCSVVFESEAICSISGGPGSGQHFFLRLLGLMEVPDSGTLAFQGDETTGWSDAQRAEVQNAHFGFLFPSPFLLPAFNVVENVAMPYFKLRHGAPEEAREPTRKVLEMTGLEDFAEVGVEELPLEMQHRVALARALVTSPKILVIEKIDALLQDDELIAFLELLGEARKQFGTLILFSTETPALAGFADRALELVEGRLVADRVPRRFFS